MSKFGTYDIPRWRKANLMSQNDLARAMGIAVRTVQYWESAGVDPSPKLRRRFAVVAKRLATRTLAEAKAEVARLEQIGR